MNASDADRARESSDKALKQWCAQYKHSTKVSRTALCVAGGCMMLGVATACYVIGSLIAIVGNYLLK